MILHKHYDKHLLFEFIIGFAKCVNAKPITVILIKLSTLLLEALQLSFKHCSNGWETISSS